MASEELDGEEDTQLAATAVFEEVEDPYQLSNVKTEHTMSLRDKVQLVVQKRKRQQSGETGLPAVRKSRPQLNTPPRMEYAAFPALDDPGQLTDSDRSGASFAEIPKILPLNEFEPMVSHSLVNDVTQHIADQVNRKCMMFVAHKISV